MAVKKKNLKIGGLRTYISDILPELNMFFGKLVWAVKILTYHDYSKRKGFGF